MENEQSALLLASSHRSLIPAFRKEDMAMTKLVEPLIRHALHIVVILDIILPLESIVQRFPEGTSVILQIGRLWVTVNANICY